MTEKTEDAGDALQPTTAQAWPKKTDTITETLPSGGVAELRRPPLSYYVAVGDMPKRLLARVKQEGPGFFRDPYNTMDADELRVFADWMIACSFVTPRVSMTRKAGCVYIGDLTEDDKGRVMELLGLQP